MDIHTYIYEHVCMRVRAAFPVTRGNERKERTRSRYRFTWCRRIHKDDRNAVLATLQQLETPPSPILTLFVFITFSILDHPL